VWLCTVACLAVSDASLSSMLLSFYVFESVLPDLCNSYVQASSPSVVLFLSIYSQHFTLRRYSSSSIMSSLKFMLTPSSFQPSRLGDSLVSGGTGVGLVRNGSPVEITQQSEDVHVDEVAIPEERRAKQICDADRERFCH